MNGDFIRKQYDHEVERQDKIVSSLSLPVGILTALGSAAGAMVQGFSYAIPGNTQAFYVLIVADIAAFVTALYFLRKAMFGQEYEYLPRLFDLKGFKDKLVAFHTAQGQTGSALDAAVSADFEEYLLGKMIKGGTKNAINNDQKSAARYYANWSVWAALIITGLMVLPYAVDKKYHKPATPAVHVDNLDSKLRELENGRNRNGDRSSDNTGAAPNTGAEAGRPGESGREGRDGGNGTRPPDNQGNGAKAVSGQQQPQPQPTPPQQKPTGPDNVTVRKPGPGTVEHR